MGLDDDAGISVVEIGGDWDGGKGDELCGGGDDDGIVVLSISISFIPIVVLGAGGKVDPSVDTCVDGGFVVGLFVVVALAACRLFCCCLFARTTAAASISSPSIIGLPM